jgi:transposase
LNHIAIDLHDSYSQICVMSPDRVIVMEAKIPTTATAFREFFRGRERSRVIFETGPHALWVGELVRELGHEVIACHPRRLRLIAESRNKNDRVDAEFMARLSLADLDLIRPVRQRSRETLDERSITTTRAALVENQKTLRLTLRGIVKPFGVRLSTGRKTALTEAAQASLPPGLRSSVDSLLDVLHTLALNIRELDKAIEQLSDRPHTQHMMTIPGIGPLISVAYSHTIEDPTRFSSGDVAAFIGLTPVNRSSAGKILAPKDRGRPGDPYVRSLLIQAAWTLVNSRSDSELAQWGRKKIEQIGRKKGPVAIARKLAVLMHHLWLHEEDFIAHPSRRRESAA